MNIETLTRVLLKLFGVYWLVAGLVGGISILFALGTDSTPFRIPTLLGYIAFGAALIWFPGTVADRVLRVERVESGTPITTAGVLDVGIALLGIWFTVVALSALLLSAGALFEVSDKYAREYTWAVIAWSVQFVIGLAMLFARRHVVRLIGAAQ